MTPTPDKAERTAQDAAAAIRRRFGLADAPPMWTNVNLTRTNEE